MLFRKNNVIPADVPRRAKKTFMRNYAAITHNTDNLLLFACDQKIEHMDHDFQGPDIAPDVRSIEHIFNIASKTSIGALASHFGIISRYAHNYATVDYIVKLNGKTNLVPTEQHEPLSNQLWSVQDVLALQKYSGLSIRGVGYTVYLGSEYEHIMLTQAAQIIRQAHEYGLVAIIWMYPRGKAITDDALGLHLAGATGVATSLGADFVKIKAPRTIDELTRTVQAAGNTKVICSGGEKKDAKSFFEETYVQLHEAQTGGCAVGRNIFQRSENDAIAFTQALAALLYKDATAKQAMTIYKAQ